MRKLAALGLLSMTGCQAVNTVKGAPASVIDAGMAILSFVGNTLLQFVFSLYRGFFL